MESMMESPRFNQSGNCKEHLRLEMDSLSQNANTTGDGNIAYVFKNGNLTINDGDFQNNYGDGRCWTVPPECRSP